MNHFNEIDHPRPKRGMPRRPPAAEVDDRLAFPPKSQAASSASAQPTPRTAPQRVFGQPGSSLGSPSWSTPRRARVEVGLRGERSTAGVLAPYATGPYGPTVFHDLRNPVPGLQTNIDHVVVVGTTIHLLDSKVWKPGIYWTWRGRAMRGREIFKPAETDHLVRARRALENYLGVCGVHASFAVPLFVIWPTDDSERIHTALLGVQGGAAMSARQFRKHADRTFGTQTSPEPLAADPRIVRSLKRLIIPPRSL